MRIFALDETRWSGHSIKFVIYNFIFFFFCVKFALLNGVLSFGHQLILCRSIFHVYVSLVITHELQLHTWFCYDICKNKKENIVLTMG